MAYLKRSRLGISVVAMVAATLLGCKRGRLEAESAQETVSGDTTQEATGQAPPIPQAGPLAKSKMILRRFGAVSSTRFVRVMVPKGTSVRLSGQGTLESVTSSPSPASCTNAPS